MIYKMEFAILSETLYSYKQFMDEQQVISSAMFRQIIDKLNLNSEDLSKTKTKVLVFIQQLDTKNMELREEMKKEFEEMKKEFNKTQTELRQEIDVMRKEIDVMRRQLSDTKPIAQSYESEW